MSARALNDNMRYNEPLAQRLARKPRDGDDADDNEKQKQRRKQSALLEIMNLYKIAHK